MYRGLQDVASEKTSVNVDTHIARRLKQQINIGDLGDFNVNPQDIMQTTESVIEGIADIVKLEGCRSCWVATTTSHIRVSRGLQRG